MNVQIDASIKDFMQEPEKHVLRLKTNLLVAEKKGIWTWIKTKWDKSSYQLPTIIRRLEQSQEAVKTQFLDCLQVKVAKYNSIHPEHAITSQLFAETIAPVRLPPKPAETYTERPLVSDAMSMRSVADKYKNPAMRELLLSLGSEGYQMREVHGDGHCCFRAFGAHLLSHDPAQVRRKIALVMDQIRKDLPSSLEKRMEAAYATISKALQNESPRRILLDPIFSTPLVEFLRIAAAVQVNSEGLSYLDNYVEHMAGMDGASERHGGSTEIEALGNLFQVRPVIIPFDDAAKPLGATYPSLDRAITLFSESQSVDAVNALKAAGRELEKRAPRFGDAAGILKVATSAQSLIRAQSLFRKANLIHEALSGQLTEAATLLSKMDKAPAKDVLAAQEQIRTIRQQLASLQPDVPQALKAENVELRLKKREEELSKLAPSGGAEGSLDQVIARLQLVNKLLKEAVNEVQPKTTLAADVKAYEDQMRKEQWNEPLASLKDAPLRLLFLGHGHYNLLVKS